MDIKRQIFIMIGECQIFEFSFPKIGQTVKSFFLNINNTAIPSNYRQNGFYDIEQKDRIFQP